MPRSIAILLAILLAAAPATPVLATFSDVPASNLSYANAIAYVEANGIVSGYPDGTFRPDASINRAEFTKIIVNARFDAQRIDKCDSTYFSDGVLGSWYAKYVCTAKDEGIIDGYPDGTFRPASPINRAEAAKIIAIAFGLPLPTDTKNWYDKYVDALGRKTNLFFDPYNLNQPVTRGLMAEIIYLVMMSNDSRRPSCINIGTANEGWSLPDGSIQPDKCANSWAECRAIGSKSEGWYAPLTDKVIYWAACANGSNSTDVLI